MSMGLGPVIERQGYGIHNDHSPPESVGCEHPGHLLDSPLDSHSGVSHGTDSIMDCIRADCSSRDLNPPTEELHGTDIDRLMEGDMPLSDLAIKCKKATLEQLRRDSAQFRQASPKNENINSVPRSPSFNAHLSSLYEGTNMKLQSSNRNGDGTKGIDQRLVDPVCGQEESGQMDLDPSLQEYLDSGTDIVSHPLYKRLCAAHISLCKLGATDQQLKEMEELSLELESKLPVQEENLEANPELDKYINDYCEFLEKYKNEFAKPFDEAMEFCKGIDEELANAGAKFLREKDILLASVTNETISRLQDMHVPSRSNPVLDHESLPYDQSTS